MNQMKTGTSIAGRKVVVCSRCSGNHNFQPMEHKVKTGGRMLEGKAGGIIMIGNTYVVLWYYTLFKAPHVY